MQCGHKTGPAGHQPAAFWGLSAAFLGLADMAISALAAAGWRGSGAVRAEAKGDPEKTWAIGRFADAARARKAKESEEATT